MEVNKNPLGRRVGDCAIRAISVALGIDWETAFCLLAATGYRLKDVMNADYVIGAVLKENDFTRSAIPNSCSDCYTANDFSEEHKSGTYVLFFGGHVATIKDGILYDSWDSSNEIPQYYWGKEAK